MKRTFGAASSGEGATYAWEGNKEVGQGSMEIAESVPPSKVAIKLDFVKPMAATSTTEFTFTPQGSQTTVNWAMFGQNHLVSRAVCMFMNQDKMVGGAFEQGLANMKAIVEAAKK